MIHIKSMTDRDIITEILKKSIIKLDYSEFSDIDEPSYLVNIICEINKNLMITTVNKTVYEADIIGIIIRNNNTYNFNNPIGPHLYSDWDLNEYILLNISSIFHLYDLYIKNENSIESIEYIQNIALKGNLNEFGKRKLYAHNLLRSY